MNLKIIIVLLLFCGFCSCRYTSMPITDSPFTSSIETTTKVTDLTRNPKKDAPLEKTIDAPKEIYKLVFEVSTALLKSLGKALNKDTLVLKTIFGSRKINNDNS